MNDELKPCPFCGGEAIAQDHEPHEHSPMLKAMGMPDHPGSTTIECCVSGCNTGQIADTRAEAVAMWNRRATPPPAASEGLADGLMYEAASCRADPEGHARADAERKAVLRAQVPQAGAGADDDRPAFEEYWRKHRLYLSAADLYRLSDGTYQSPYAQRGWEAWQAALALRQPQGDWTKDAEDWGGALNDAAWEFVEVCPEKSALLFNHCKPALRAAILKYASAVAAKQAGKEGT